MNYAREYVVGIEEMSCIMDSWSVFCSVAGTSFAREDVDDKRAMLTKAVDEFRSLLTAKAMVVFSETKEEHQLKPAIDSLLAAVDGSVEKSDTERAEAINPILQDLGSAITDYFESKSDIEQPVPENKNDNSILEEIRQLLQPVTDEVARLSAEVQTVKSQSTAANVENRNRIPAPRTAVRVPALEQKSKPTSSTPNLRSIIDKSLG
jgi:hypothetical protein